MSVENAKAFIEKVQSDESLQAKLKTIMTEDKAEAIAAVVKFAAEHGHSFEAEHYEEAAKSHIEALHSAGTLSDEDLDRLVGGMDASTLGGACTVAGCIPDKF